MNKSSSFLKSKKYYILAVLVIATALYFVFAGGNNKIESYTVNVADLEQSVVLSGDVRTSDRADLGFASGGRISKISVKNNQIVRQGQVLAQLEIGGLLADLRIKQINMNTSGVDLLGAKDNVERVTAQENLKVNNAYKNLLSTDLELTPEYYDYNVTPPVIKGAYVGNEGTYKIYIDNTSTSNYFLQTFNLEKLKTDISREGPTPLGTKGLFITFPDKLERYYNTTWYLDIPNKTSSSYLASLNAWNEAKENRDRAIRQAELEYQKLLTEKNGNEFAVIQAEIDKINAEIRRNTIYAPFSGKVTNLEKKTGENASNGEVIISILGEEQLEIVLQVSELDVSKLVPGSSINITLDALPGETFVGTLRTINSKETKVEGVPVYEAFVELSPDERIKTGMSAKGTLVLASRQNVVSVPAYFVKTTDQVNTVKIVGADGKTEEREVVLGLVGSDNMVEVVSGLTAGEKIAAEAVK
ncbi:MAG TPA: efflux RND transporter periplasmic adaptor subunit [Candidatus Paceibacterota bacterium]|nr:efflux RND transporter periplasmic adaptor subunit [Candidatus Paceibacterota bacterium]